MPVYHQQFTTQGTDTWTCPDDVYGVIVECIGPGGNGSSSFAGGGGAYVRGWFDVIPGEDYDVFIADHTGLPASTYFINPETIRAARGEGGTGSGPGFGGDKANCLGTLVGEGDPGLLNSGGDSGGNFYSDPFTSFGVGGGAPNGTGGGGAIQISWRVGATIGNGGGGGGGYARSVLSVTPDDEYSIQVGTGGIGQYAIEDDPEVSYIPLQHGGPSWFGNIDLVRAAGGDSSGTSFAESPEDDDYAGLVDGALGGGQPGSNAANIGDITYPGGNGGAGNGIRKIFGFIGGGGGGVAGRRGGGENGFDGKDGGGGGPSSNDFNYVVSFPGQRHGTGGNGMTLGTNLGQEGTNGRSPGGGSCGDVLHWMFSVGSRQPSIGAAGRVTVSGTKTGRLLVPGF